MNTRIPLLALLIFGLTPYMDLASGREFTPGVYREYIINTREGLPNGWRVTDPKVVNPGGLEFLPNPVFTFRGVDLEGAIRAEITMHHWLGHSGSTGQQMIINGEHRADIPLNPNLAPFVRLNPASYHNDDNPIIAIPLDWLKTGDNTIEGTFAEAVQGKHWWGQWGWYWIGLRVFHEESTLEMPTGRLVVDVVDKEITGNTVSLRFETTDESINQVDFFAKYYGFDEDGDAVFYDWHGFENTYGSVAEGAIGRDRFAPFTAEWDVSGIPDQQPGAIGFIAVIRRGNNTYRVCEPVLGYTLKRDYSIKLFRPTGFPTQLIRNGTTAGATIPIPSVYPLEEATSARMLVRTWNGYNNEQRSTPVRINNNAFKLGVITGRNHLYGFDDDPIDVTELKSGENIVWFTSTTVHHGCEILVPGPCILVRWDHPVPDYLVESVIMPGWYLSRIGYVHYQPEFPDWHYSPEFEWLYAYAPFAEAGWYHSSNMGFVWSASSYPWVYLHREAGWFYFLGKEDGRLRFYDPVTGDEVTLP